MGGSAGGHPENFDADPGIPRRRVRYQFELVGRDGILAEAKPHARTENRREFVHRVPLELDACGRAETAGESTVTCR